MLEALREAVRKTLERKRRLGQYAVIRQDGKAQCIGEEKAPYDLTQRDGGR